MGSRAGPRHGDKEKIPTSAENEILVVQFIAYRSMNPFAVLLRQLLRRLCFASSLHAAFPD
jgi:hypothetical protein